MQVDDISAEDYFAKSIEFAMWLKEAKGLFFSNLSSEETRKLFAAFVEVWNAGRLSAKYYQGIKAAPRTAHKWGIKLDSHENALLGEVLSPSACFGHRLARSWVYVTYYQRLQVDIDVVINIRYCSRHLTS